MAIPVGDLKLQVRSVARDMTLTSTEILTMTSLAAVHSTKTIASQTVRLSSEMAGFTMDTVNRHTKDFNDVGNFGKSDLSDDMGSMLAGAGAMIAVNSVRIAKVPLTYAQIGVANALYNDKRMEKAFENAKGIIAKNPEAANGYWNIMTDAKRNRTVRGFNPRTRYLQLNLKNSKTRNISDHFMANRPNRMLNRKSFLISTAEKYRTFSLRRSIKDTFKNQLRKNTNLVFKGNNPIGMENQIFYQSFNTIRRTIGARKTVFKTAKAAWTGIKTTGKMIRHPVKTLRGAVNMVGSLVSSGVQVITAILSAVVSLITACLPVVVIVCIVAVLISMVLSFVTTFTAAFTPANSISGRGEWVEIPICDEGNTVKDYAWASQGWTASSDQSQIWHCHLDDGSLGCAEGVSPSPGNTPYGGLQRDDDGFYYYLYDNIPYYTNAVASYYSTRIGDRFRVTTDTGAVFHIIVADQKADADTKAGNVSACNTDNCISGDGSMLEFYVDPSMFNTKIADPVSRKFPDGKDFTGAVVKMEKWNLVASPTGNVGDPDFSNTDAWRHLYDGGKNPYIGLYGQCTWGAWGKFYEMYGFGPTETWDGKDWARGIVNEMPDKFELASTPKAGAVFSGFGIDAWGEDVNHVGIILDVQGDLVTIFEANINRKTDSWDVAIHDWRILKYTLQDFINLYPGVEFANPRG